MLPTLACCRLSFQSCRGEMAAAQMLRGPLAGPLAGPARASRSSAVPAPLRAHRHLLSHPAPAQQHVVASQRSSLQPTVVCRATQQESEAPSLVGEDAAAFALEKQSVKSWGLFFFLLTTVLGALYVVGPAARFSVLLCSLKAPRSAQLAVGTK